MKPLGAFFHFNHDKEAEQNLNHRITNTPDPDHRTLSVVRQPGSIIHCIQIGCSPRSKTVPPGHVAGSTTLAFPYSPPAAAEATPAKRGPSIGSTEERAAGVQPVRAGPILNEFLPQPKPA